MSDPYWALGECLTASEAQALAAGLETGQHVLTALKAVNATRRERVAVLLAAAGLGHENAQVAARVLRAVAGAKAVHPALTAVWTMPGHEAQSGHLTSEFHRLVASARQSVVCATYNFAPTSAMWLTLRTASEQPGVLVTVYVDADTADAEQVKAHLPRAAVYRSARLPNGHAVVSHAKFVIIDHTLLLLTSANFSYSAENTNVEFGLLVSDSGLAEAVESTMRSKHGVLYEMV